MGAPKTPLTPEQKVEIRFKYHEEKVGIFKLMKQHKVGYNRMKRLLGVDKARPGPQNLAGIWTKQKRWYDKNGIHD